MGRLITHNTRHNCKTPVMAEQYLREQTAIGTIWLEDKLTNAKLTEHKWVFNQYAAGPLVNAYHSDKLKNRSHISRSRGSMLG